MDLTPVALRETTFRGALRGYNVNDVDEFVEQVAMGVGELIDQVRQVSERAAAAERRAKQAVPPEEAMKRTLAHAQKLAESVVAEARQKAERTVERARAEAERLHREAGTERDAVRADVQAVRAARAEVEAQRAAVEAETGTQDAASLPSVSQTAVSQTAPADPPGQDLQREIDRLAAVRRALESDVAVLTTWLNGQRASVRAVLVETLAAIDRSTPAADPPLVTVLDASVVRHDDRPASDAPALTAELVPAPIDPTPPTVPDDVPGQPKDNDAPAINLRSEPDMSAPLSMSGLSDDEFLAELKKAALKETAANEAVANDAVASDANEAAANQAAADADETTPGPGGPGLDP